MKIKSSSFLRRGFFQCFTICSWFRSRQNCVVFFCFFWTLLRSNCWQLSSIRLSAHALCYFRDAESFLIFVLKNLAACLLSSNRRQIHFILRQRTQVKRCYWITLDDIIVFLSLNNLTSNSALSVCGKITEPQVSAEYVILIEIYMIFGIKLTLAESLAAASAVV